MSQKPASSDHPAKEVDPRIRCLLDRADADVAASLNAKQAEEIQRLLLLAVTENSPKMVDLRVSVPLLFTRMYMNILVGRDRRVVKRPRAVNPAARLGNFVTALYLLVTLTVTSVAIINTGCDTVPDPIKSVIEDTTDLDLLSGNGDGAENPQPGGQNPQQGSEPKTETPPPENPERQAEEDPGAPDAGTGNPGDAGSNGTGDGAGTPPPPPPMLPPISMSYFTYTPDGYLYVADGVTTAPYYRPLIIDAFPELAAYGFGRYMSVVYMGCARDDATSAAYFGPLADAAEANNIKYVPGLWLHDIVANIYGPENQAPWNVTGANAHLRHPMNPFALIEQRFWDDFVVRVRRVAQFSRSNLVMIEAESVFYLYMDSPFWTDQNMALIKPMIRGALQQLQAAGVYTAWYHPQVNPYLPSIDRINHALFMPEGPNDILNFVEHLEPTPYYRTANWTIPECTEVGGWYTDRGYDANTVSYGFMSDHAGSVGFSPQQFTDYLLARPGLSPHTWFFSGTAKFQTHVQQFYNIAMNGTPP